MRITSDMLIYQLQHFKGETHLGFIQIANISRHQRLLKLLQGLLLIDLLPELLPVLWMIGGAAQVLTSDDKREQGRYAVTLSEGHTAYQWRATHHNEHQPLFHRGALSRVEV